MSAQEPLDGIRRRAGAATAIHHGRTVVLHYGSAAGELAVCIRGVGIVDRCEIASTLLRGEPEQIDKACCAAAGTTIVVGGVARADHQWWCRLAPRELLVLSESPELPPTLGLEVERDHGLTAIGVVGAAAPQVLDALGAFGPIGDPRTVPPLSAGVAGGVPVWWLLESDHLALVLVERAAVDVLWHAIEEAGRPFRISFVGRDAAERYALLDRSVRAGAAHRHG
jgi:hypothetical protein